MLPYFKITAGKGDKRRTLSSDDLRLMIANWDQYEWTVQGFGMLRTYLDEEKKYRLNIWDSRLAVPGVSTIHDHPWHFDSLVVAGIVINNRFEKLTPNQMPVSMRYAYMRIRTGEGGGPAQGAQGIHGLRRLAPEVYLRGNMYHQDAHEIHESMPVDGTVTLNARERLPDGEHATVWWPQDQEWVDACPRVATPDEVRMVARDSLRNWF